MRLVYTENLHGLDLPPGHKFPVGKYGSIYERLARKHPDLMLLGTRASWEDLTLAHTPDYVRSVRGGTLSEGAVRRLGFPWSRALVDRSTRSVGGTLTALAWAIEHGAAGHIAGGTHHAFADRGEGFCVFNDIAVAVCVARRDHRVRRVAVVDLDVHQGNGTAAIFARDPDVLTLSLHGERNYPFRKETSTLDVALADGCDDAEFLAALDAALPAVERHAPDLVFFQAGVDPLAGDKLGRMGLTQAGLRARNERVFALAKRLRVPLVVTLGGGYHRRIEESVEAHANVFLGLVDALG
jgi:acetoin utilization deacetylase AcuC-like enzyme